ncbi:MAG: transposase, partial [Acidimicrobiales bacterium]
MSQATTLASRDAWHADPPRNLRGKSKTKNWRREKGSPVSVIRLPLDASDPLMRHHLEGLYQAAFDLKRALRSAARSKCRVYWAAARERDRQGPKAVRERLGLSRESFEHDAYRHLEAATHLARYLTKALAMHIA